MEPQLIYREITHLTKLSSDVYHILLQAETTIRMKLSSTNNMKLAIFYECLDSIEEINIHTMDSIRTLSDYTLDNVDNVG